MIGTYITPSYELGLANKITKIYFIISLLLFNYWGLIIAFLFWLIHLVRLRSFNKPYLYPLIPFDFKRFMKVIIRFPYRANTKRKD